MYITEHAIDRYIERVDSSVTREEAKSIIYSLVIDNFLLMDGINAYYPIGNKFYAIVKNKTIVTVSRQTRTCDNKPVNKKHYNRNKSNNYS